MGSKLQLNNAYLNSIIVYRHITQLYQRKTGLKRHEVEVIMIIDKLTRGINTACTLIEVKVLCTGQIKYNLNTIVQDLLKTGYILDIGKKEFHKKRFLKLSETGVQLISSIHVSLNDRIAYINDQVKLRAIKEAEKAKKRLINKKAVPGLPAPLQDK